MTPLTWAALTLITAFAALLIWNQQRASRPVKHAGRGRHSHNNIRASHRIERSPR